MCNLGELIPIQESGINLYDVTKQCTVPLTHSLTADTTPTGRTTAQANPHQKQTAFVRHDSSGATEAGGWIAFGRADGSALPAQNPSQAWSSATAAL